MAQPPRRAHVCSIDVVKRLLLLLLLVLVVCARRPLRAASLLPFEQLLLQLLQLPLVLPRSELPSACAGRAEGAAAACAESGTSAAGRRAGARTPAAGERGLPVRHGLLNLCAPSTGRQKPTSTRFAVLGTRFRRSEPLRCSNLRARTFNFLHFIVGYLAVL
jgi:hypothetical protein